MTNEEREELADSLRELADFLMTPAGLVLPRISFYSTSYVNEVKGGEGEDKWSTDEAKTKSRMVEITLALKQAGVVSKRYTDYGDGSFTVSREFGSVHIGFQTTRKAVCVAKQVGTERVPIKKYVETGEMEDKPVIEWECEPLLAPSE